jgi:mannose-1-phosphate guanylyltransferase
LKAFLLAAGLGTRLRPLTDRIPKCLVPICGKPLLQIWFEMLQKHGVDEVLVNTHYLADQVQEFVANHKFDRLKVTLFYEAELLGSAGTVAANRDFVGDDPEFLVIYADNLTDFDLSAFIKFHRTKGASFSMALFESPEPTECGIASLDENSQIIEFEEKPAEPKSAWANAGLYIGNQSVLDLIPEKPVCDFGYDVLPLLVGKMYGFRFSGFYCDTGTPERLERARIGWKELKEGL